MRKIKIMRAAYAACMGLSYIATTRNTSASLIGCVLAVMIVINLAFAKMTGWNKKRYAGIKGLAAAYMMLFYAFCSYIPTYLFDLFVWGLIFSGIIMMIPDDYVPEEYVDEDVVTMFGGRNKAA